MITSKEELIAAVVGALVGGFLGGSGLAGFLFLYLRRFIDKRLDARERDSEKRHEERLNRLNVDDELFYAQGRMFYFLVKFVETGHHNGDFQKAWDAYQAAEEKKKNLDRKIIAEHEADL